LELKENKFKNVPCT